MTTPESESGLSEEQRRIIELTQGFRDLASDEINVRLSDLYRSLVGEMSLMDSKKSLSVRDEAGILTSYEVPPVLRRLLLEDNEAGNLDIAVLPPHPDFTMVLVNPSTRNSIYIGAGLRPYALPLLSSGTRSGPLSSVAKDAAQYADIIKGDEHVIQDYKAAKKLIGATRQIAAFDGKLAM